MLSRRDLIVSGAAAGGGLVLAYGAWRLDDGDAATKFAAGGRPGFPLNAWLKIDATGDVTCAIHRAEMGQGITTGLAQLLIEELDADWSRARFEFAPVDRDYYNFGILEDGRPFGDPEASWWAGTGTWAMRRVMHAVGLSLTVASTSTIDAWDVIRPAGAAARQMLIAAAAHRWQTDPRTLRTEPGFVIDPVTDRRAGYGELAEAAAREMPPPDPPLKPPSEYRIVGHDVPRLDTTLKVDGTAVYASDVELPDMLYATVVHSPVVGTRVATFDANGADEQPGVVSVLPAGEHAVAVVARDTWTAMQAAKLLQVEAHPTEVVDTDELADRYFELLDTREKVVIRDDGAVGAALDTAATKTRARYSAPYLAHECMEPMSCVAHLHDGELELWVGTQSNSLSRDVAAAAAGVDSRRVTVHSTFMGGAFGRRADMDFVEQAASIAAALPGRPIKLTWSRQQDLRHDSYRPFAVARIEGAVGGDGSIAALRYEVAAQSVSADYARRTPSPRKVADDDDRYVVAPSDIPLYDVGKLRAQYVPVRAHVPVGYWRSVSYTLNPFFLESFIDELAAAADADPLDFRRRALAGHDRHLSVLDAAEAAAGPLQTAHAAMRWSNPTVPSSPMRSTSSHATAASTA